MKQTTEKHFIITKNTAFFDETTLEGRLLLSALTNKEQFYDYFEDIYENLEPGTVETVGEYDNHIKAEVEYQKVKDLEVNVIPSKGQVVIIWACLLDEDGTMYGKSFYRSGELDRFLSFMQAYDEADEETREQVRNLLNQNAI